MLEHSTSVRQIPPENELWEHVPALIQSCSQNLTFLNRPHCVVRHPEPELVYVWIKSEHSETLSVTTKRSWNVFFCKYYFVQIVHLVKWKITMDCSGIHNR